MPPMLTMRAAMVIPPLTVRQEVFPTMVRRPRPNCSSPYCPFSGGIAARMFFETFAERSRPLHLLEKQRFIGVRSHVHIDTHSIRFYIVNFGPIRGDTAYKIWTTCAGPIQKVY